jgi:hypothetical protein
MGGGVPFQSVRLAGLKIFLKFFENISENRVLSESKAETHTSNPKLCERFGRNLIKETAKGVSFLFLRRSQQTSQIFLRDCIDEKASWLVFSC